MSFHERAVKADKEVRKMMMKEKLLKKYPYIVLSRFRILTHIDRDAKAHPEVLFTDTSRGSTHEVDYPIEGKSSLLEKPAIYAVPLLEQTIPTTVKWRRVHKRATQG